MLANGILPVPLLQSLGIAASHSLSQVGHGCSLKRASIDAWKMGMGAGCACNHAITDKTPETKRDVLHACEAAKHW